MPKRVLQRERLVITVDVIGPAGSGKTAACAEIIRAVRAAVGLGPTHLVSDDMDVLQKRLVHPILSDHTQISFDTEVFHRGA
jgi:Ni2+-binding GTPase involved in maturation of urease and hydrogenase